MHRIKTIRLKLYAFADYCNKDTIGSITVKDAKDYMNYRARSKVINKYRAKEDNYTPSLSPKTYNQELLIFRRFFNYCIEVEWLNSNPFKLVKSLKQKPKPERYYFSKKELEKIFKQFPQYSDIYNILLKTGIRFTDAYSLTPENIQGSYLSIQMKKNDEYLKIPLHQDVLCILAPRMNNKFIFPELQSERQQVKCRKSMQSIFKPEFVRKNNINLHTFRHTYAHNMLNKGVPKEVLQNLLGHKSITTTEIYANWFKAQQLDKWVNLPY